MRHLPQLLLLIFFIFSSFIELGAQVNELMQQQARAELQRRGVDETAVREKLKDKGIDIDNVSPDQLPGLQSAIESAIKEVESEQAARKVNISSITPAKDTLTPAPFSVTDTLPSDTIQWADTSKLAAPSAIYGQHLFRDKSIALFRSTLEIKPPDTYILSTGDALTISVFGPSQFDSRFEINKEGYIQPLQMPKIFLKGLTLGQAKALLRSRFEQRYRFAPEQFAVTLSTMRNITVNIFGEAQKSGSFTLPALNTAFNALVAAGGPTDIGSVRTIQLVRGRQTKTVDVYALMHQPTVQADLFLEDNDIIYIPVADRVVEIEGAVRRPFRFELIAGEQLNQLIELAGGVSPDAFTEAIQVKRYEGNRQVLLDVPLRELQRANRDFELRRGDIVVVRNVLETIDNTAEISGAVEQPGQYALSTTPKVSDLVRRSVLLRDARTDMAFVLRKKTDGTHRLIEINLDNILRAPGGAADVSLEPGDKVTIYSQKRFSDAATISIVGAVRAPLKSYPFAGDSAMTLRRAVLLAGGLRPDANGQAYILRTDPLNPKLKSYLQVNLNDALANPESAANSLLQPFDRIEVLSSLTYTDVSQISVTGAVRTPGKFQYSPTLSLKDVLLLAGGMRIEAATNRIDVFRVQFNNNEPTRTLAISLEIDRNLNLVNGGSGFQLYPYDEIVVRSVPDFEFQRFVELNGEVKYPGKYALINANETLSSVVERAGGLTNEADAAGCTLFRTENNKGFVVTRLQDALQQKGGTEDHILKNGDVINIPKYENLVTIKGGNTELNLNRESPLALNGQISAAYNPGKRANWYIREYAGGFSKQANRNKVTVEAPNGKVSKTNHLLWMRIYPKVTSGATIYVQAKPVKPEKEKKAGKNIDWDKKLTQIIAFTGMITSAIIAYATISKL